MSSAPNHRRHHGRVQERGPRWENPNPAAGCNSTHVARARRKWRHHGRRKDRRNNRASLKIEARDFDEARADQLDFELYLDEMLDQDEVEFVLEDSQQLAV